MVNNNPMTDSGTRPISSYISLSDNYNITDFDGRFKVVAVIDEIVNQVKFKFRELTISIDDEYLSTIQTQINNIYSNMRIGFLDDKLSVVLISDDNTLHMYSSDDHGKTWLDIVILDILTPAGMEDKDTYMTTISIKDQMLFVSITESLDKLVITDLNYHIVDSQLELTHKEVNEY